MSIYPPLLDGALPRQSGVGGPPRPDSTVRRIGQQASSTPLSWWYFTRFVCCEVPLLLDTVGPMTAYNLPQGARNDLTAYVIRSQSYGTRARLKH